MSKHVEVVLNSAGVVELLKSQEMMQYCTEVATAVKNRCGNGYSTHRGINRVNVSVVATTDEANQDNYENNTLLKALGSFK